MLLAGRASDGEPSLARPVNGGHNAMSLYAILADAIVAAHVAYVSFVVLGQLAILVGWPLGWTWIRNPWFRMTHLAMILIVVVEALPWVQYECPLTTWEYDLRAEAGQIPKNYRELALEEYKDISFIGRNLNAVMFAGANLGFLDWIYYAFGATVVLTLLLVPPRFRKPPVPAAHVPAPEPPTLSEPATAMIPPQATSRDR
jgi:Protein of Unknown function (DUF2784)